MDLARVIPEDGENPYANHPGFDAVGCPLQYTVTKSSAWGGVTGGFGCQFNGGHCLPGDACASKVQRCRDEGFIKEI